MDLPDTQEDYEEKIKLELLKQEEPSAQTSIARKKNLLPLIIQLNDEEFSHFLDQNR